MAVSHGAFSFEDPARSSQVDPRLLAVFGRERALSRGLFPIRSNGAITRVAVTDLDRAEADRTEIERHFGPVALETLSREDLIEQVASLVRNKMTDSAETCVSEIESCRSMAGFGVRLRWCLFGTGLVVTSIIASSVFLNLVLGIAVLSFLATTTIRLIALTATLTSRRARADPVFKSIRTETANDLPSISVLVPLFKERDIAGRLIKRLEKLDYPADKLEICLIVETDDRQTRRALRRTALPSHVRLVTVPPGRIRTKPRALNYATPFTQGQIIGIYDAEDAPAPDQLRCVAQAFADHGPHVACVQGVLDFYNARRSWITRCFAIDYATWFRLILPGLDRLGLVVPLGGTTLFFRREALNALDGWDAHNVTEDADLGLRLARRGYRTVLIPSVTKEEATDRPVPWIRQRSRWLKGYALTWLVHMRRPRALWGELGPWKFVGVQVLFLGTLLQYLLWPFLLVFWLLAFSPAANQMESLSHWPMGLVSAVFVAAELVVMLSGVIAVSERSRRWLAAWVPTMIFYFPLGVIALYKGLFEAVFRPFYWDKTTHGRAGG